MKTKFKFLSLMAVSLLTGLASCSNDDQTPAVEVTPRTVKVEIITPSTYAEEASAVGKSSLKKDLNVYFIGAGIVKHIGHVSEAEMGGGPSVSKAFADVPGDADKVIVIGNATHVGSPNVASINVNDPESKVNRLMFEQDKQIDPQTKVNLHGSGVVSGAGPTATASVDLLPAISRIEIGKIEVNPAAEIPLSSFELEGIYINNTYTQVGTDYSTLPTAATDILNYAAGNSIWTAPAGTYPQTFCDEFPAPVAGASVAPAAGKIWAYNVLPVVANKGTTIDGVIQSSVPHIVLKVKNVAIAAPGFSFPAGRSYYVVVTKIKDAGSGNIHTKLDKGKAYSIASIAFGGEHLKTTPVANTNTVTVSSESKPWVDAPSSVIL